MCFSASASFGAGIALSVIGVASLKQVRNSSEIPFAAIPLVFASQQIIEGVLWLSLYANNYSALQITTTYLFLFIAQVIWPSWVPIAIYKIEPDINRKRNLRWLLVTGFSVSLYLLFCLINYNIEAMIVENHISYGQDYPKTLGKYSGILYVISTVVPLFISSVRKMRYLGSSIFISYVISAIFYEEYIVSVWCFFAAIISTFVLYIILQFRNSFKKS